MENLQDESDADARLVAEAKNLRSRMLIESAADSWGNLQSRISFATDAVANTLGLHETAPVASESEYASFPLATASVANEFRDCKFSISLQQLLSHLNWRLQVWNDLATAPVANVSDTASSPPS